MHIIEKGKKSLMMHLSVNDGWESKFRKTKYRTAGI